MRYYAHQAGTGVATYSGVRYQRGNGFFGRLMKGGILRLLRYLGERGLETAATVATEA